MKKFQFFLLMILLSVFQAVLAVNPEGFFSEWTRIDITGSYNTDWPDWRYEGYFETRNLQTLLDFSSGYRFSPSVILWSGFTWISPNQKPLPMVYRPWQHLIWNVFDKNPWVQFQIRTRLEELKQEAQPEMALRLRERWRIAFPNRLPHKITPVIYDEVFFNLNHPAWVTSRSIDQNRFFVGIDTPRWKNTYVEIGYLNQYAFPEPIQKMTHILYTYFMIDLS